MYIVGAKAPAKEFRDVTQEEDLIPPLFPLTLQVQP
jgi:hypothetical protein